MKRIYLFFILVFILLEGNAQNWRPLKPFTTYTTKSTWRTPEQWNVTTTDSVTTDSSRIFLSKFLHPINENSGNFSPYIYRRGHPLGLGCTKRSNGTWQYDLTKTRHVPILPNLRIGDSLVVDSTLQISVLSKTSTPDGDSLLTYQLRYIPSYGHSDTVVFSKSKGIKRWPFIRYTTNDNIQGLSESYYRSQTESIAAYNPRHPMGSFPTSLNDWLTLSVGDSVVKTNRYQYFSDHRQFASRTVVSSIQYNQDSTKAVVYLQGLRGSQRLTSIIGLYQPFFPLEAAIYENATDSLLLEIGYAPYQGTLTSASVIIPQPPLPNDTNFFKIMLPNGGFTKNQNVQISRSYQYFAEAKYIHGALLVYSPPFLSVVDFGNELGQGAGFKGSHIEFPDGNYRIVHKTIACMARSGNPLPCRVQDILTQTKAEKRPSTINLVPNPASTSFSIQNLAENETYRLVVLANDGRKVMDIAHVSAQKVDIAKLVPGLYSVQVYGSKGIATRRLLVQ